MREAIIIRDDRREATIRVIAPSLSRCSLLITRGDVVDEAEKIRPPSGTNFFGAATAFSMSLLVHDKPMVEYW